MSYADIAVAVPVEQLYTYRIPADLAAEVAVGKRVLIPFGKRYMIGYVVQIAETTNVKKVKEVADVLDVVPVITPNVLRLTRWIADYYLCPWGLTMKAALPAGLDVVHELEIRLAPTPPLGSDAYTQSAPGAVQKKILVALRQQSPLTLKKLQKKIGKKGIYAALHLLEQHHLIETEPMTKGGKASPKMLQHVALQQSPESILKTLPDVETRAPQQATLLRILLNHAPGDLAIVDLGQQVNFDPRSPVKALERKGYVRLFGKQVARNPLGHMAAVQPTTPMTLTTSQQRVLTQITKAIDRDEFAALLLHGVTGSGKTEVYLQAIAYPLNLDRKALVMVPEISLTPLLVSRFLARFGERIAVLHSKLSIGERLDEWQRIHAGKVNVVIGARSAIFAPIDNLGLIVVDEEHELSYKQDTIPRYHGRDTAVMRARLEGIPIVLGSATPSLESFYNASAGKYTLLSIPERIDHRPLPEVEVIDMRKETGPKPHLFSSRLEESMREVLDKREQVLLFLNMRGFANFYLCQECGFIYECPRCSVTLTFHASSNRLQCHYCDFSRLPPSTCEQCHNPTVQYRGIGTEQVEQAAQVLFPEAAVARMDRDKVTGKHGHYDILRKFEQKEIDLLIGTQMVTKGHDFPNVTLVGVIAAETSLNLPDFRASERTFQILTQVAGRTGRGELRGEVIVQTYTPSHYAIVAAQTHGYATFYEQEIAYRKTLNYPPFSRVVNLVVQGHNEELTCEVAGQLARYLRASKHKALVVLGPSPAAMMKLRNRYRYQILLKSTYSQYMRSYVKAQIESFRHSSHLRDIQIIVDVDPVNLL